MKILQKNKDITNLSNFKTKAFSNYYFEINSYDDINHLKEIKYFSKLNNLKILFIGIGTNILFAFDLFDGIIIKNNLIGWSYDKDTKILESYSNELISQISIDLENEHSQNLWHRFIGLPGSIGGAVFGNAGCFGLETENNFIDSEVFDLDNGILSIMSKKDMFFSYRSSILKQKQGRYFLVKSRFDLSKKIEKYSSDVDNIEFRKTKQPKGNTCGSFFKNPSREQSAGHLIEQVGLKGKKIGGAYFSNIHSNFLMNDGSGTYKDLLDLINLAKKEVMEKFKIELINEVRIITND